MWSFAIGVGVALALAAGSVLLFEASQVTSVERYSPDAWVRVEDERSRTAEGTGYGMPAAGPERNPR